VFAGGLPAEAKFTDAKTGQLLAAAVGRAAGTSSLTSGTATPAQLPVE
jgi:hypothetical protein